MKRFSVTRYVKAVGSQDLIIQTEEVEAEVLVPSTGLIEFIGERGKERIGAPIVLAVPAHLLIEIREL